MCKISNEAYELLTHLINKAKNTTDGYLINVDIPSNIHRDRRRKLTEELEQEGYIERISFNGKRQLSCKVKKELL